MCASGSRYLPGSLGSSVGPYCSQGPVSNTPEGCDKKVVAWGLPAASGSVTGAWNKKGSLVGIPQGLD